MVCNYVMHVSWSECLTNSTWKISRRNIHVQGTASYGIYRFVHHKICLIRILISTFFPSSIIVLRVIEFEWLFSAEPHTFITIQPFVKTSCSAFIFICVERNLLNKSAIGKLGHNCGLLLHVQMLNPRREEFVQTISTVRTKELWSWTGLRVQSLRFCSCQVVI